MTQFSAGAQNEVNARGGGDHRGDLTHVKAKGDVLKRLLHFMATKETEVTPAPCRGTVGLARRQLAKVNQAGHNVGPKLGQDTNRVADGPCLDFGAGRILPARGPARLSVFDQDMTAPHPPTTRRCESFGAKWGGGV